MASAPPPRVDLLEAARADLTTLHGRLGSGPQGLSTEAAQKKIQEVGPNQLPEPRKVGIASSVYVQVANLFNVLLVVASALSFVLGVVTSDPTSVNMGFAILAVVIFNIGFNLVQERRAEKVVEALRRLIPANAKVTRDGRVTLLPVSGLVPGDIFALDEGDRVPADARLVSAFGMSVDQSVLSGESALREASAESHPGPDVREPTECRNLVLAGTTIASGSGTAIALATGADTVFGRIIERTREIRPEASPLQRELSRTGKINLLAAFVVALGLFATAFAVRNLTVAAGLLFMIAVIIDLVPEGLQITVTLALAIASLSMARRNVVVKRLASVETLGSSTVICSDKTGTITAGQMTVRKVWIDGTSFDVTGQGYNPEGRILLSGQTVTIAERDDLRRLCEIAAFDNAATLTPPVDRRRRRWTAIGDTTDAALLALSLKGGVSRKDAFTANPRIALVPFDSSRKLMTSVHRGPDGGITAYTKGAAHAVLQRAVSRLAKGGVGPLSSLDREAILREVDRLAADAFRVLALAYRPLPRPPEAYTSETVEQDLIFVGLVAIYDPPRPDVPDAVLAARGAGIKVIMITGDHELTAEAIARRVGIITGSEFTVVTGGRLAEATDDELSALLRTPELVFARANPEQKHRIVKALRAQGEIVAVTGDGVNDVPALAEADIGIAMGITGTDVAREAADMVLLDDNFATIVRGVELGRGVFDNLKAFLVYVFTHNWAELMSFLTFVFLGIPAAIGVVQVLSIDLVMEIPTSLALTAEPPHPDTMTRPPRGRRTRLFDLRALLVSAYVGVPSGTAALLIGCVIWARAGWTLGMDHVSDPAVFAEGVAAVIAGIMLGQIGNFFARRSQRAPAWSVELRRNPWVLPGLLGTLGILLALVYVPIFQPIFSTGPLTLGDWALILLVAPLVLGLEEGRKAIARRVSPAPTMRVPAVTLPASVDTELLLEGTSAPPRAFVEYAPPILIPLPVRPWSASAIPIAIGLAEHSGSRLIVARLVDDRSTYALRDSLGELVEEFAHESKVPCELVDAKVKSLEPGDAESAAALRKIVEESRAETIVVPVRREFLKGRRARGFAEWIEAFADLRVVIVRVPPVEPETLSRPRKVLIPVLHEFRIEPFEIAPALTASRTVPDVEVVAAKVIRLPPSVPLYSTYRPESLVDRDKELSFLETLRGRPSLDVATPKILLVREVARDLLDWAEEREVELIVLAGDWTAARRGFLSSEEREIATAAKCAVVVVLPARSPSDR